LYIEGDVEESLKHMREAIRINPEFVESRFNLGKFLLQQGHPEEALPELQQTLQLRPKFASGEEALATALQSLGNRAEALAHWRKALTLEPKSITALSGAAWLLATSQDASTRSGAEAVELAGAANEIASGKNPEVIDTLAAAYAESGDFVKARLFANQALDLAVSQKDKELIAAIRSRVQLYAEGKPFREDRPQQTITRILAHAR
jgi:Flp pilus assembly protein TadD